MARIRPLTAVVFLALAASSAWAGDWEQISEEEGVTVWRRDVPGTSFVAFRGRGVVRAPIQRIVAIIINDARKCEWVKNCAENRAVQRVSYMQRFIYNRVSSPVPFVSDRDVVLDARIMAIDPTRRVVRFEVRSSTHPKAPEVNGVVRMRNLLGTFELEELGPREVRVTYEMQADPAGSLPAWLVNWASRALPRDTILGLRRQVLENVDDDVREVLLLYDWTGFQGAP